MVHDWLQGVIDKLEVCREPSTDKHSIQSKLDRLGVSLHVLKITAVPFPMVIFTL